MEIRNLPVSVSQNLAKFFEGDDSILSLLMGNIARDLDSPDSTLRFTSSDIDSIRNHAHQLMKSPVLILLDEWSTMGKSRPKLHHLIALLVKCQLFRAAEYIAQLVGEEMPERPDQGPAAKVDISLPDDIDDVVNGLDYPYSAVEANRDRPDIKLTNIPPEIKLDSVASTAENNISIPFIRPPQATATSSRLFQGQQSTHRLTSDLIKFSRPVAPTQPSTSAKAEEISQLYIPALSALQISGKITVNAGKGSNMTPPSDYIPALSGLMSNGDSHSTEELPAVLESFEIRHQSEEIDGNVPSFSRIFSGETSSQTINDTQTSISSSDSDV